ncbi:unnamed protein product [Durusdinium trenchii]|uniref:Uncharacterized protein n=1 Tax=Durusdinium trenchii TaxID=1381693 RepID=A0ABP0ILZ0_9DINO
MLTTPVDRQDILEYLSLFTDPSKMNADAGATVHPLDVVMNAFQDTCAGNTCQKIHTFLEDDIGPPAGSMDSRVNVRVPLNAIRIHTPDDGLPVIEDFLTTVICFIFSGSRLDREPLDLTFVSSRGEDTEPMDDSPYNPSLSVKKGFTRLTAGLFLVLLASDLDPDIQPTQALQMSLRFEKLMVEERFKVSLEEKTDVELLGMLIDRYNTYKSNLAIRKWQISDDMRRSIEGIVIGMTPTTKRLIRSHLDFNKWEESAYNESILKSRRHRLHEGAKGVSGQWVMILTVSEAAQELHFKKYNQWWSVNARRVKRSTRSRLRWGEEVWSRHVDQCCVAAWVVEESRKMPGAKPSVFTALNNTGLLNLDYGQDLDALLIAKPATMKVEMTAMWQDNVGRALIKSSAPASGTDDAGDIDEAEVLHLKSQLEVGLGIVEAFMQKRLLVTVGSQQGNIATMQRRVLQEAKSMFDGADLEHMHHIGYADLLKLGRLAAPDVQELADWCYKILSINPNFSVVFIAAPLLAAEGPLQDENTFTRCDYWNLLACKPAPPLNMSEYVAYELMGELQETCFLGCSSEAVQASPVVFNYAMTQIKDKLLEDWKAGRSLFAKVQPKYNPTPEETVGTAKIPTLKICNMVNGHLSIPQEMRQKWLNDPIRNPDWRVRLHNFDSVFQPVSDANAAPRTAPTTSAENMDLAETNAAAKVVTPSETIREAPAGITVDQFKAKYPTLTATVVLSLQEQAKDFLSKSANENKAIEFRLQDEKQRVVFEESSTTGKFDSLPMPFKKLMNDLEKEGHLDTTIAGHKLTRPAAVMRGEEADR